MGLLNKIRNDHDTPAVKQTATTLVDTNLDGKPTEPAARCPSCGSPTFWRSAYGGGLHCAVCDPWPSLAMVGERWTIYTRRDGSRVWVRCLRRGERARVIEEPTTNDAAMDGVRSDVVEEEDGAWLVIWKVRT